MSFYTLPPRVMHHASNRSGKFKRPVIFRHYHLTTEVRGLSDTNDFSAAKCFDRWPHPPSAQRSHICGPQVLSERRPVFCCADKSNVRFWHLADMACALQMSAIGAKGGRDILHCKFLLMTQSGHGAFEDGCTSVTRRFTRHDRAKEYEREVEQSRDHRSYRYFTTIVSV